MGIHQHALSRPQLRHDYKPAQSVLGEADCAASYPINRRADCGSAWVGKALLYGLASDWVAQAVSMHNTVLRMRDGIGAEGVQMARETA